MSVCWGNSGRVIHRRRAYRDHHQEAQPDRHRKRRRGGVNARWKAEAKKTSCGQQRIRASFFMGRAPRRGRRTIRTTQFRFVAIASFAVIAAWLTAPAARAFSLENGGATGGGGNAAFADPDDQIGKMFGLEQTGESSRLSSPVPQPGKLNPYRHFHIDSFTSPPDPLSRPSN